jgi:peptide/nickel transport system permease protein
LLYLSPGDPARILSGVKRPNAEVLEAIRNQYHLNEPFFTQFFIWVKNAATLNFGNSIKTGMPVTQAVAPHLSVSLQLIFFSLFISVVIGVVFGVVSAKRKGRLTDKAINLFAVVGTSAPSFAVGLLFLYVFAYGFSLFPVYGIGEANLLDRAYHLFLPGLTLVLAVSAIIIKVTRSSMLNEIGTDYTMFLKARGVSPFSITKVQVKNASGPILTSSGLVLASLIGATVLIETTFAIPGIGNLLANAVTMKDVPLVQFLTLVMAFFICLSGAIIDIIVYFINPFLRKEK